MAYWTLLMLLAWLSVTQRTGAQFQFLDERQCPIQDKQKLSSCVASRLEDLRPFFKTGLPERNIPPGDPLYLAEVRFIRDGLTATYNNLYITGFSAFKLKDLSVNPGERLVTFDLTLPAIGMAGDYDVEGRFLTTLVTSRGNFSSIFQNVGVTGAGRLRLVPPTLEQPGKIQMEGLTVHVEVGNIIHNIDYSADTHKVIGETVKHFVTRNDRLILEEMRPEIEDKVAQLMGRLINSVLLLIPVDA